MYIRNDQADIRVSVGGVPYGDSWKEADGGSLEVSSPAKARPGGMGDEVSIGGLATRSDLTVRTNMTDVTAGWVDTLENLVGYGRAVVTLNWLNPDGTPVGTKSVRRGTLKTVTIPNMGADSALAMFEIIVDCDEKAG